MQSNQEYRESVGVQRRLTKQRRIILDELCRLSSHPTADELYQVVRQRMPNISLGTVYRNLDFLAEQGQIAKIEHSGSQMRFDGLLQFHQHICCIQCGMIGDVFDFVEPPAPEDVQVSGFTVVSSRIEYEGICAQCEAQKGSA